MAKIPDNITIKVGLDVSEATEKLNRYEDQIDRILEKQQLIGVDIVVSKHRTSIANHIVMKDGQPIDVDDKNIEELINELMNIRVEQLK